MTYYTLEKHNDEWVVWENTINEHSGGVRGVFRGTKSECKGYVKTHSIKLKRANLSIFK